MTLVKNGVNDTSQTSADVVAIKAVTDDLVVSIAESTGTFSYDETSASEQDAIELTITTRSLIGSIWIDMTNVTQTTTISVYHKIDGTNYRKFQENSWGAINDDGVLIEGFAAYRDAKITFQCSGGGAGSVNVLYTVV